MMRGGQQRRRHVARTVRNAKISTRSSRCHLPSRREPYWTTISAGCALGYRRGKNGGTWIAKFRDEDGQRHYGAIGAADDARDPDGISVFSFAQAQEHARTFFVHQARVAGGHMAPHDGPYTVADAVAAYMAAYERRGGKAVYRTRKLVEAHILPSFAAVAVAKLTAKRIEDWHHSLAEGAPRIRSKPGHAQNHRKSERTVEGIRQRRSTANRILTVLKAALNHCWKAGHALSDDAWRRVAPFRSVETARIRYLTNAECVRLVNACETSFRDLVRSAILTGCRYAELATMQVADFNPDAGTVTVRSSKAGKPRHVVLAEEGRRFFEALTAGKTGQEPIFVRHDGKAWGASHQRRPIREACRRAKIEPAVSFHVLRHTHGSALAMRGVPMGVIAEQLGHADTRMTEKHYAHLSSGYVADTIRAHFPTLGISEDSKVVQVKLRVKAEQRLG
jgi:integrase